MRLQLACLLLVLAGAERAMAADATTYAGTIGKLPVIVELKSADDTGAFVGRYAYLAKGVDIPLHGKVKGKGFMLEEEKPCTDTLCKNAAGDVLETAPIGGEWTLKPGDGDTLVGLWKNKDTGKTLPVKLEPKGKRAIDDNAVGFDAVDPTFVESAETPAFFTPKDLPYDFLKLARPLKQGTVTTMGDSAFRLDEDTRAQLTYPVIVKLGNEDPAPLNTYLHQQRLQWSLPAFSCMSRIYMGFGWQGQPSDTGTNGYEGNDTVSVLNLTPRLMSIEEGGSYFCGGAYPDNFVTHRLVDARTGKPLVANSLLRGWVAKDADGKVVDPKTVDDESTLTFGPSDDLVKYVISHRTKRDDQAEADCGIDDLIASNFGVYFTRDAMIFTLDDLPHVIFACGDDLVKVPLKDARPFLTDAAAKYFEALDP